MPTGADGLGRSRKTNANLLVTGRHASYLDISNPENLTLYERDIAVSTFMLGVLYSQGFTYGKDCILTCACTLFI